MTFITVNSANNASRSSSSGSLQSNVYLLTTVTSNSNATATLNYPSENIYLNGSQELTVNLKGVV